MFRLAVTQNKHDGSDLNFFYLCYVFEPSTQSYEDEEHGWSIEECDGALVGLLHHGHDKDHTRVDVCNGGS